MICRPNEAGGDMFKRGIVIIFVMIACAGAPTIIMNAHYNSAQDQAIRPLALSRQEEARIRARGNEIVVQLEWGALANIGVDPDTFGARLVASVFAHGEDARLEFIEVPNSSEVWITYLSGANTFGPMSHLRAANGIRPVIDAFRMSAR